MHRRYSGYFLEPRSFNSRSPSPVEHLATAEGFTGDIDSLQMCNIVSLEEQQAPMVNTEALVEENKMNEEIMGNDQGANIPENDHIDGNDDEENEVMEISLAPLASRIVKRKRVDNDTEFENDGARELIVQLTYSEATRALWGITDILLPLSAPKMDRH